MKRISRRRFVQTCGALGSLLRARAVHAAPLEGEWQFARKGGSFAGVTLPHCVAKLSWQDWDPAAWEDVWIYRKQFSLPREFHGQRVFLQFDGVMVRATPAINGHALSEHLGGYLPFHYEITEFLRSGENVLDVAVDSRWQNVPPEGSPKGAGSIDYLEPGGIIRGVRIVALPHSFLTDVFAKPVDVLDSTRRVEVTCTIDGEGGTVRAELRDGARVMATAQRQGSGSLTLSNLGNIELWSPETPRLYDVVTTLGTHEHRVRIGFRDARFTPDGFFLNGKRLQLFGLNRHELYPYVGAAMPARVMRRDAEMLRREFHCNMVRCSHYPQSEAFLDACDELGLMVWEEIPGWQYLGDAAWKDLAVRDVHDMVSRDRNHPSVVIWGVRINESANDLELYRRTRETARALDDSRPTSGSMTSTKDWQENWRQDVFAFDDYHSAPDGTVGIHEPLSGVPYMLAEAVGQFNYTRGRVFDAKYRRTADIALQQAQAIRHAQAHDRAMASPHCSGVIAWCAFDYGSLMNSYRGVKYPGVADVFRIPKLGASFYQAQVSPKVRPVIAPNFYWDGTPAPHAAIFSNCERLEILLDGKQLAKELPDREGFPHLAFPPFFCDLPGGSELRIDGYVGEQLAVSRLLSADRSKDQFVVAADDQALVSDGSDATRLVFQVVDRYGAVRAFAGGDVRFTIAGPGVIVGDNPFLLTDAGGSGAVWIRSKSKGTGPIVVTATHSALGSKTVRINAR